jgi:hypothetical protein
MPFPLGTSRSAALVCSWTHADAAAACVQARKHGSTQPSERINLRRVQLVRALLDDSSRHVRVDNLPASISEAELRSALARTPDVASIKLLQGSSGHGGGGGRVSKNGCATRSALLELSSATAVEGAVAKLSGLVLDGRPLAARRAAAGGEARAALQALVDAHQDTLARQGGSGASEVCAQLVSWICTLLTPSMERLHARWSRLNAL